MTWRCQKRLCHESFPVAALIAAVFLLTLTAWIYRNGVDSFVLIHDNLDSNVVWFRMLAQAKTHYLDLTASLPGAMGNLPVHSISAGPNIGEFLYLHLDTLTAFILNEVVVRLVAFWGMFLLLRRYVVAGHLSLLAVGVSLGFALLPFWPSGFLSVAGQPLLLYVFLNLRNRKELFFDWLYVFIFPFYSSLVLTGFTLIIFLGCLVLWDYFKGKGYSRSYLVAFVIFMVLYGISNDRLIYAMLFNQDFISHRVQAVPIDYSLGSATRLAIRSFTQGQYHAASLHGKLILPLTILVLPIAFCQRQKQSFGRLVTGLSICLFLSVFYGGWKWLKPALPHSVFLQGFQWERVHFLHPLIWHLLFAVGLLVLMDTFRGSRFVVFLVTVMVAGQVSYAVLKHPGLAKGHEPPITYEQFFSPQIFDEVATFIAEPKENYRVAALGFHPAILQYNGFQTLDGYFANYPLGYKNNFRKIIAAELAKSPQLRRNFDNWGNRCYIFSSEIGYSFLNIKRVNRSIKNLQIDILQFYEMGGRFLISAVPVLNFRQNGLVLKHVFEREESPWRFFLYEVNPVERPVT